MVEQATFLVLKLEFENMVMSILIINPVENPVEKSVEIQLNRPPGHQEEDMDADRQVRRAEEERHQAGDGVFTAVRRPGQDRGHPPLLPRLCHHRPLQGGHLRLAPGLQQAHPGNEWTNF